MDNGLETFISKDIIIEPNSLRLWKGEHNLTPGFKSCSNQVGLMKDHGQQARASENFAGPVDFETPRADLPVHF